MVNPGNDISLRVLLGFLKAGRVLDHSSSVLLLGTLLLGARAGGALGAFAWGGAVVLGLFEKYLAWRVALDAEFFALLLEQPGQEAAFDTALAAFLGRPGVAENRPMASRCQGARRLVRLQAAVLGAQALAIVAGLIGCAVFSQ